MLESNAADVYPITQRLRRSHHDSQNQGQRSNKTILPATTLLLLATADRRRIAFSHHYLTEPSKNIRQKNLRCTRSNRSLYFPSAFRLNRTEHNTTIDEK